MGKRSASLKSLAELKRAFGSSSVRVCWAVAISQTLPDPRNLIFFARPSRFKIRLSRAAMYCPTSSRMKMMFSLPALVG